MASAWWLVAGKDNCRQSLYATLPLTLAVIATLSPFLLRSYPMVGLALQRGFALVCHQQPERSFVLLGGTVAVCARCLGIYLGAAVGLLLRMQRRVAMRFLIWAVAINAVDRLTEFAGLHGNWMLVRFAFGIALGTAAAMLVAASLQRIHSSKTGFHPTRAQAARRGPRLE